MSVTLCVCFSFTTLKAPPSYPLPVINKSNQKMSQTYTQLQLFRIYRYYLKNQELQLPAVVVLHSIHTLIDIRVYIYIYISYVKLTRVIPLAWWLDGRGVDNLDFSSAILCSWLIYGHRVGLQQRLLFLYDPYLRISPSSGTHKYGFLTRLTSAAAAEFG